MITLITGSMFSGKTSMMLHLIERAYIAKKKVVLIRPETDTRQYLSHTQKDTSWLKEEFFTYDLHKQCLLYDHDPFGEYDVMGIDEGQFQPLLKDFCKSYWDKDIIISALHATSECEMFQPIVDIIPYCENIIKLNAICMHCGSEFGSYTYYLKGEKTEKISVGGEQEYTVLCQKCYQLAKTKQIVL